jgi:hypothetical protein
MSDRKDELLRYDNLPFGMCERRLRQLLQQEETIIETCHVCHSAEKLQHLEQMRTADDEVVYAHPRCVMQHNKQVKERY